MKERRTACVIAAALFLGALPACGSNDDRSVVSRSAGGAARQLGGQEEPDFICQYPSNFRSLIAIVRGRVRDSKAGTTKASIQGLNGLETSQVPTMRFVIDSVIWRLDKGKPTRPLNARSAAASARIAAGKELRFQIVDAQAYPASQISRDGASAERVWLLTDATLGRDVDAPLVRPLASLIESGGSVEFSGPCREALEEMSISVPLFAKEKGFETSVALIQALATEEAPLGEESPINFEFEEFVRLGNRTEQKYLADETASAQERFDSDLVERDLSTAPATRRAQISYLPVVLYFPLTTVSMTSARGKSQGVCAGPGLNACLLPIWDQTRIIDLVFGIDGDGQGTGQIATSTAPAALTVTDDQIQFGVAATVGPDGAVVLSTLRDGDIELASGFNHSQIEKILERLAAGSPLDMSLTDGL